MEKPKLIISPKTRVGELLEAYPELEELLMSMAPAFKKLKNPILRRTVGRVASLQQAAAVGNISIDHLVNTLRKAAGQDIMAVEEAGYNVSDKAPDWMDETSVKGDFDASAIINKGESPMQHILSEVHDLGKGELFIFRTPFLPAPILEKLKQTGVILHVMKKNDTEFITFVKK
jgi:hypothetical protein